MQRNSKGLNGVSSGRAKNPSRVQMYRLFPIHISRPSKISFPVSAVCLAPNRYPCGHSQMQSHLLALHLRPSPLPLAHPTTTRTVNLSFHNNLVWHAPSRLSLPTFFPKISAGIWGTLLQPSIVYTTNLMLLISDFGMPGTLCRMLFAICETSLLNH